MTISPTDENKTAERWPIRELVIGIVPLLLFVLTGLILRQGKIFNYRPSLSISFAILIYVAFYIALIYYPYVTLKRRGIWPLMSPISRADLINEIIRSFGYVLLITVVTNAAAKTVSALFNIKESVSGWEWIRNTPNAYITMPILLFGVTIGPVAEEYFFRGFLFNAFKTRFPLWLALISQALLFSIVHRYGFLGSFRIFLMGIGLALIYQYRKTLLSPILVHSLTNALWAVPLILLTFQNYHQPAKNWVEARKQPEWFTQERFKVTGIDKKYDADAEVDFVIHQWGSKGAKKWKKEAVAFAAIENVFPNDHHASARAVLGLSTVYLYHLRDYRRAVVEADELLSRYPEQKEQCAWALVNKGYAFFYMRDYAQAKEAFQKVLKDFNDADDARKGARKGLDWIDHIAK